MPRIAGISTVVPEFRYTTSQLIEAGRLWLHGDPVKHELFERFLKSSRTEIRNFVEPVEQLLTLNGAARRAELFEKHALRLSEQSQREVLKTAGRAAAEIESLIFTSCTCPAIPSIDGALVHNVGFRPTVKRTPIYQHGCAGGVIGLGLAQSLAGKGSTVMLTSAELCSLVFYPNDHSGGQLVGSALFADGAASVVIDSENSGLVFRATQSYLIPETRHLMGYDLLDDGAHLRLDRDLPSKLVEHVPAIVREFLDLFGLKAASVPWWLFHPGGIRILDFLDQAFSLKWDQSRWAREVLSSVGNLSSASVLFVLKHFMDSKKYNDGDHVLMLGVGPGLTIELILFEAC